MPNQEKPASYTFTPEPENKRWMEYSAKKNRRSMASELNILIEKARLEDKSYSGNQNQ